MDSIKSGCNKVFNRFQNYRRRSNSDTSGYIIVTNFEEVSEETCTRYDIKNEKHYRDLLSKAKKACKTIKNSGLSMNLEVPPPPHPSNRDRYILWKKRNISCKVIPQSEAVVFLTKSGYELNVHYEAYQAIDLAKELKRKKGISDNVYKDTSKNFDNVYNEKDKNILRQRSIYGMDQFNRNLERFNEPFFFQRSQSLHNIPYTTDNVNHSSQYGHEECDIRNTLNRHLSVPSSPLSQPSNVIRRNTINNPEQYQPYNSNSVILTHAITSQASTIPNVIPNQPQNVHQNVHPSMPPSAPPSAPPSMPPSAPPSNQFQNIHVMESKSLYPKCEIE